MNLVIDIGNTFSKSSVFHNNKILKSITAEKYEIENVEILKKEFPEALNVIVSSVKDYSPLLKIYFQQNFNKFLEEL